MTEKQIKSKKRVKQFAEVFTAKREVSEMLDLVKDYSYDPHKTFLEPACGNGNFLAEILQRKLQTVQKTAKTYPERVQLAKIALQSIYGVDIQADNVRETRDRLLQIIQEFLPRLYNDDLQQFKDILTLNIQVGDFINGKDKLTFMKW